MTAKTWGRVIRVVDIGTSKAFYDIGIDKAGNLFINTPQSSQTSHVLTISPDGQVTITGNLTVTGKLVAG